jgi:hypothetical protein
VVDIAARYLVYKLFAATDGRPLAWHALNGMRETSETVARAVERGRMNVRRDDSGGRRKVRSASLTDEGRRLARKGLRGVTSEGRKARAGYAGPPQERKGLRGSRGQGGRPAPRCARCADAPVSRAIRTTGRCASERGQAFAAVQSVGERHLGRDGCRAFEEVCPWHQGVIPPRPRRQSGRIARLPRCA